MAKSKQDYLDAGKADAAAGKPRAAIAAATWQAKYYDQGYDSVDQGNMTFERVSPRDDWRAEGGGPVAEQHGRNMAEADHYAKSEYMPAPVVEHIGILWRSIQGNNNVKRATRVKVKIAHLEAKYASRAARA